MGPSASRDRENDEERMQERETKLECDEALPLRHDDIPTLCPSRSHSGSRSSRSGMSISPLLSFNAGAAVLIGLWFPCMLCSPCEHGHRR